MTARGTDWGLAALIAALVVSGVLMFLLGAPSDGWAFASHNAVGFAIALLVVVKLRRVWGRIVEVARWDQSTMLGLLALALVVIAVTTGALWSDGATPTVLGLSMLVVHDASGVALALIVVPHAVTRAKRIRGRDLADRRQLLAAGGIALASVGAWRFQRPFEAVLGWRGASRRFTGSYEAASFEGNVFPSTSWVADNPRPIDQATFRLKVRGLVADELSLTLAQLRAAGLEEVVATLDCTGGFYSTQRWTGVRLGQLIDRAGASPAAHHVSVKSVTGYRWSYALPGARELLLATHVGTEPLNHIHGAPVRLVAPGERGFQWVKWVNEIELRSDPDYGAPASTVWSSFTSAGSGGAY